MRTVDWSKVNSFIATEDGSLVKYRDGRSEVLIGGDGLLVGDAEETVGVGAVNTVARQLEQRRLWDEHVQYTRMAIVAFANGLPELAVTQDRLLQNQDSIGAAFGEVFGQDFGEKLAKLLREHILGSVKVLKAAKAKSGVDEAIKEWYANSDEIAALLASTGRWPEATLRDLLHKHLDTTITEATAELGGQWAESIAAYDVARAHALVMADALAKGMS